jgi:E3 ubiquitin-protein ligase HERC3
VLGIAPDKHVAPLCHSVGNIPASVVVTGSDHTCILFGPWFGESPLEGAVKCWGSNEHFQLGLGEDMVSMGSSPGEMGDALPTVKLGTRHTPVHLVAGGSHTCALLESGSAKCWGNNYYGQLGLGDTADTKGGSPWEMGNALPMVRVGRTIVLLAAGDAHTCALLDNDSLKCWGSNIAGQLGLGDTLNRGRSPGEMGDALPAVDLGTGRTAVQLAAGGSHTCALLDNGSVK